MLKFVAQFVSVFFVFVLRQVTVVHLHLLRIFVPFTTASYFCVPFYSLFPLILLTSCGLSIIYVSVVQVTVAL